MTFPALIDTHCHLTDKRFDEDRAATIERARGVGVTRMITIGTSPDNVREAKSLARANSGIYHVAGLHPHEAKDWSDAVRDELRALALEEPRAVAIGETGLDYHYDFSPRADQWRAFEGHLALAIELDLPVVIHCREAAVDVLSVLEAHRHEKLRGVFHCFSEGPAEAERAVAMNFRLGLGGVLTFPKSDAVRAAAKAVPPEMLLFETDAPYLAPVPKRGKRNEPSYIPHVLDVLASALGRPRDDVAAITTRAAESLFRLSDVAAP